MKVNGDHHHHHDTGPVSEAAAKITRGSAALIATTSNACPQSADWWAEVMSSLVGDLACAFSLADGSLPGHVKALTWFGSDAGVEGGAAHLYVSSVGSARPPSVSGRLVGSWTTAYLNVNCLVYQTDPSDAAVRGAVEAAVSRAALLWGLDITPREPSERVGPSCES